MAQSPCRPCQPRPAEGDVGDRELPHGSPRRPCRALRRLRLYHHSLQLLPQPALPKVPGCGGQGLAGRARGRPAAGAILPCRVYATGGHRQHRLPQQGRDLRPPVQGLGRDPDHHRGRPKTPRRPRRQHLGARVGIPSVLHSWGSAMTHHPHVHMIVPGGGISLDGERWVACRTGFFLPVRVLSRLFRRLFLERLLAAHQALRLKFFGDHVALADAQAFTAWLAPLRRAEWVVYAKRPFGGPQAVLAYLSRYTHRVAIANSRLIACDRNGVTFRWKDYRAKGPDRQKVMTLATAEFIRRFLIHVLPHGFHRIRHYGLLASGTRADNIAQARRLLDVPAAPPEAAVPCGAEAREPKPLSHPCPCCGGSMTVIERFQRGCSPRYRPATSTAVVRLDTS